jgi:hypothetical protein
MAPATHQPVPSDTQGNASRQLALVVVFGRRVAPAALWRLTFEALIPWVVLNAGGSGLAVGVLPRATCRACDPAPVVPPAGRDTKTGVFLQDKQIFCLAQRGKENAGARYAATESAWSLLAK